MDFSVRLDDVVGDVLDVSKVHVEDGREFHQTDPPPRHVQLILHLSKHLLVSQVFLPCKKVQLRMEKNPRIFLNRETQSIFVFTHFGAKAL